MATQYTLSIIKPDAVRRNLIGKIISYFETAGLEIAAQRMAHLTKQQAEQFYKVHAARPFFSELVESMISGPVVLQVLKGENAVDKNREVMGATNPKDAAPKTIRADFALSIGENSVHGSDSEENAKVEVEFFFSSDQIIK